MYLYIYISSFCALQLLPILIVMNIDHFISFIVIFCDITYYYFVICENEKNNNLLMKTSTFYWTINSFVQLISIIVTEVVYTSVTFCCHILYLEEKIMNERERRQDIHIYIYTYSQYI